MVQGHVRATSWGFESPLRHYFFAVQKNSFENLVRIQDGAHEARHFFCGGINIIPIPDYQMALRPDNIGVVQGHVRVTS